MQMAEPEKSYVVVERRVERVRVTMEWEVDAEVEDTVGGGVRCNGWFTDTAAIMAACDPKAAMMTIENAEVARARQ